jgi:hypothetical protein
MEPLPRIPNGRVGGSAATPNGDGTERERERSIALPSDAVQDEAAVVAHELRQPLTTMLVGISTLRRHWERLESDQRGKIFDTIERHGHRMGLMLEGFLEANRPDSEVSHPAGGGVSTVRVRSLILRAMEGSSEGGAGVAVKCDANLLVDTDAHRAEQLLVNLIDNALRHGHLPVIVTAAAEGDSIHISVRDHGPGVDPDRVGDLFERWSPLSDGGTDSHGLGLFIVSELAETLGGDVAYEPASPGARFVVSLPIEAPTALTAPARASGMR